MQRWVEMVYLPRDVDVSHCLLPEELQGSGDGNQPGLLEVALHITISLTPVLPHTSNLFLREINKLKREIYRQINHSLSPRHNNGMLLLLRSYFSFQLIT